MQDRYRSYGGCAVVAMPATRHKEVTSYRTPAYADSLVTHGLSTAYQISDIMYVLFQGTSVEHGNTCKIIENPKHPYVQELIDSIPVPDPRQKWDTHISLPSEEVMRMKSSVGCRFYPRCPKRMDVCATAFPAMVKIDEDHEVACYLYR